MKSLIKIKTITSGLLLILMLVINGVKLLHKHDDSHALTKKNIENPHSQKLSTEHSCTICEYQFAKDTDFVYFFTCTTPLVFFDKKNSPKQSSIFFRPDRFISGRAPPAFV